MINARTVLHLALTVTASLSLAPRAGADAPLKEKAAAAAEEVKKDAKKVARAASDAACPIVDGKAQCAAKKIKHKAQNAADEVTK